MSRSRRSGVPSLSASTAQLGWPLLTGHFCPSTIPSLIVLGSSGSEYHCVVLLGSVKPCTSCPSLKPSPSVSAFVGSVPSRPSSQLVSPSPSVSVGSEHVADATAVLLLAPPCGAARRSGGPRRAASAGGARCGSPSLACSTCCWASCCASWSAWRCFCTCCRASRTAANTWASCPSSSGPATTAATTYSASTA